MLLQRLIELSGECLLVMVPRTNDGKHGGYDVQWPPSIAIPHVGEGGDGESDVSLTANICCEGFSAL